MYLGVRFDRMNRFHLHTTDVIAKTNSRTQAISALTGATWGPSRQDLRLLLQAFVLPVITYSLGAWGAHISATSSKKLETALLRGCRAVTGLHRSTQCKAVHIEANISFFTTIRDREVIKAQERSLRPPRATHAAPSPSSTSPNDSPTSCHVDHSAQSSATTTT